MRRTNRQGLHGATLIECVSAILVLGIAIPPLVGLFGEVATHDADRLLRGVGLMYADAMMEEIASKAFEDPDLASGTFGTEEALRATFDDVDDYDGLNNSPPERLDGTLLADYGGFGRSATVENVTSTAPDPVSPEPDGSTNLKRIRVMVDWPGGSIALLTVRSPKPSGPSPIAELLSAAAATDDKKKFFVPLINISGQDLLIASVSLRADAAHSPIHRIELDGQELVHNHPGLSLPTGVVSLADVDPDKRTIPTFEMPTLEVEFNDEPSGTITYTVVLNFTDGTSSTLTFTVVW